MSLSAAPPLATASLATGIDLFNNSSLELLSPRLGDDSLPPLPAFGFGDHAAMPPAVGDVALNDWLGDCTLPTLDMDIAPSPEADPLPSTSVYSPASSYSPASRSASYSPAPPSLESSRSPQATNRRVAKRKRTPNADDEPVDPHLLARKDDVPEEVIQRLLQAKPRDLTEEEKRIRKRAKNRQSAAVAREKRRAKQMAKANQLNQFKAKNEALSNENDALRARIALLEAFCRERIGSLPDDDDARPAKRQRGLA
ncbi:uncharacterized protein AMSG_01287 [Thecamonas trahens ATCC 50062]|uniref:BZIP domain-containing protein n=1 Tax=Thecamonas trahens ATCC 50062 TaxID=461836 RepID=A0A0L0DMQ6_THETB|nr:hypothetical protein AMSG_01287 [Thecamonas trahens ATCC 50062]KNC53577.1 hypothetical protein AMSG_01287 [Thecamonas trahens ATCC 50062]|eukprot:XP_013761894.1 hypothetical protein AMSG_01287 [Thecamonas trahens ATCC 50062]